MSESSRAIDDSEDETVELVASFPAAAIGPTAVFSTEAFMVCG